MVNEEILPERDSMHYAKANTLNLQADEHGIIIVFVLSEMGENEWIIC